MRTYYIAIILLILTPVISWSSQVVHNYTIDQQIIYQSQTSSDDDSSEEEDEEPECD